MFEHMKNYKALLQKVSTWLRPTKEGDNDPALLFVHIFCHKSMPYHFVEDDGWMAKNFFSGWSAFEFHKPRNFIWLLTSVLGGTMPSHDLFVSKLSTPEFITLIAIPFQTYFQDDLTLIRSWYLSGQHYSKTCEDWLKIQDSNRVGVCAYFILLKIVSGAALTPHCRGLARIRTRCQSQGNVRRRGTQVVLQVTSRHCLYNQVHLFTCIHKGSEFSIWLVPNCSTWTEDKSTSILSLIEHPL